ncbi:hypothetical protein HMPREF3213_01156 [Heyndrickxia coagulans]|uniref:Uncharacterized protein n=1 Tax=Heyndrickxia coagulans TaxID=1398 RepID=A0A133KX94_HEYCO|nr:hypothetical protein HMPREF3213_01156 [Heyndrickxia coagulans]
MSATSICRYAVIRTRDDSQKCRRKICHLSIGFGTLNMTNL